VPDTKTAYYDESANWSLIPAHMRDGVQRYVMHGVEPGNFLTAILENDFMEAVGRADDDNRATLVGWAMFIYNHTPSSCHGSPARVASWLDEGGILGHPKA
jgi:hypothetical protein